MRIIVFNGPPRTGKDTLAAMVMQAAGRLRDNNRCRFKTVVMYSYKWVLCDEVGKRYELPTQQIWDWNADTHNKDVINPKLGGKSVRQALIFESEENIKVVHGEHGVAKLTFERLRKVLREEGQKIEDVLLINPDGGFNSELAYAVKEFGLTRDDYFVARMIRPGYGWDGDSREYLDDPDLYVLNNGGQYELEQNYLPRFEQFITR